MHSLTFCLPFGCVWNLCFLDLAFFWCAIFVTFSSLLFSELQSTYRTCLFIHVISLSSQIACCFSNDIVSTVKRKLVLKSWYYRFKVIYIKYLKFILISSGLPPKSKVWKPQPTSGLVLMSTFLVFLFIYKKSVK